MKTIAAGVTFLLLFLVAGASADPGNGYRARHCANNFWGCEGKYRRHVRRRHHDNHHDRRRHGVGRIHHGAHCHTRRRVVGEERTSKGRALKNAERAWMGAVRYDHGERFQDLTNAKDIRRNCDPSSVRDGSVRCVVEATPCRAPIGSTDVRMDHRVSDEKDDDN